MKDTLRHDAEHTVVALLGEVSRTVYQRDRGFALYGDMHLWRVANMPLSRQPIHWRAESRDVPIDLDRFKSWSIVKLKVRCKVVESAHHASFIVINLIEVPFRDEEFERAFKSLEVTIRHRDAILGELVFRRAGPLEFSGTAIWDGLAIDVSLPVSSDVPDADAIDTLHALFDIGANWRTKILQTVADSLFDQVNEHLNDGEEPLDRTAFVQKLTLKSLTIDPSQIPDRFTAWLDDGGTFGNHWICVSGSISGGMDSDVSLAG